MAVVLAIDHQLAELTARPSLDGVVTLSAACGMEQCTWDELSRRSSAFAESLGALGVSAGHVIAVLGPTCLATLQLIRAAWDSDVCVCVLPPHQVVPHAELLEIIRPRAVLAHFSLIDDVRARSRRLDLWQYGDVTQLLPVERAESRSPRELTAKARVVQFTSGSTGRPKGVLVEHDNLHANVMACARRLRLTQDDVMVSWLPLYHDMGLIGTLALPMTCGLPLVLVDTAVYQARPSVWLELMSSCRATITVAPHSSYRHATALLGAREECNLASLRLAINGSEPIDPSAFEHFFAQGKQCGLRDDAAYCVYGLAEATAGVTLPIAPGLTVCAPPTEPFGPSARDARGLARLGAPIDGLELRVVDSSDRTLPERSAGEVEIKGSSVCRQHIRHDGTIGSNLSAAGWLKTGDIGFVDAGELVVVGRRKNVIFAGGRKVWSEQIERAAASVDGVELGRVAAFALEGEGRDRVIVLFEAERSTAVALREVAVAVRAATAVRVADVRAVPPRSLSRTTSGKLRRDACRAAYLESVRV